MRPVLPVLTFLVAPDIFLVLLIATRPPVILRLFASLLLVYVSYYTAATFTTGNVGGDYGIGSALGVQPFNVLLLLWLVDPMKEFRYIGDPTPLETKPFLKRVYNALCILRNPRCIGLNVKLRHIPPSFKGTRAQFIRSRIFQMLQCLFLLDIAQSFIHTHPEFFLQGTPAFPSGFRGQLLHFACQVAWLTCGYAALKMLYTLTALTCVCTGLSFFAGSPELWPDLFGTWLDGYTVRRTWSRVWHQQLRRYFSLLGKSLAGSSGAPRGGFLSSQIQIWVAFAISGIIHCSGDLMIGVPFGYSLPFFLMNAAAITFEDGIIAAAKQVGIVHQTKYTRLVGYVWVLMWFNYSLPTMYTWTFAAGMVRDEMLPFSLVRTLTTIASRYIV